MRLTRDVPVKNDNLFLLLLHTLSRHALPEFERLA